MLQSVKAKAGMRLDAEGFGIFELINDKGDRSLLIAKYLFVYRVYIHGCFLGLITEYYLAPEDNLADHLYNWERYTKPTPSSPNLASKDYSLNFKVCQYYQLLSIN